jgi:hypothetical protein
MIFKCYYCPMAKVGRHDNTAHVQQFVCLKCKKKGLLPPPLPGEIRADAQSPTELRQYMRPKNKRA